MIRGAPNTLAKVDLFARRGGVLFMDEAYQLVKDPVGKQILDLLLKKMEDGIGKMCVIFAGYKEEMESFFEHNPGLSSRIPWTFNFPNFTEAYLWAILRDNIKTQLQGRQSSRGNFRKMDIVLQHDHYKAQTG